MITVRKSEERGHFDHGWLDTRHTFSFADYFDPRFMGFRALRVINEDRVQPGKGFGTHAHRDMEILSWVLEGELQHRDSMGNGSIIRPGELQRMSAGTGVRHSEFNPSDRNIVHFLQIWVLPERQGLAPEYEQKTFPEEQRNAALRLLASRDGREGSVKIHQDLDLWNGIAGESGLNFRFHGKRYGWLHVARGSAEVNHVAMSAGDGAAIEDEEAVVIHGREAEILLFDLA